MRRLKSRYKPVAFQVAGTGEFPHDMLRYDCCRAASPKDQELIDLTFESGDERLFKRRVVTLVNEEPATPFWKPTVDRWRSFTWRVLGGPG